VLFLFVLFFFNNSIVITPALQRMNTLTSDFQSITCNPFKAIPIWHYVLDVVMINIASYNFSLLEWWDLMS